MINIGFWNIGLNSKKITATGANQSLAWFIDKYNLDILAVCEFPQKIASFLFDCRIRERQYEEAYHIVDRLDTRIFYSKKTISCLESDNIVDEQMHCLNRFTGLGISFNLSCVHLPSNLYVDDNTRLIAVHSIKNSINSIENVFGKNTIIVGDFNADPHDDTMINAQGFHSLPDRKFVKNGRTILKNYYDAFYNPMWNLYGDFTPPTGTYFYNNCKSRNQLWYLYDQVIMRYEMIRYFQENSLMIITENISGLTGRPKISDHFPIVFSLK